MNFNEDEYGNHQGWFFLKKPQKKLGKGSLLRYLRETMSTKNPAILSGLDFIEYTGPEPEKLVQLFLGLGFVQTAGHKKKSVLLFEQGDCRFILNKEKNSFAEDFGKAHGPSVCSLGFLVKDSKKAFEWAVSQGAKVVEKDLSHSFPAVYGVGGSLIYFVESGESQNHFKYEALAPTSPFLLSVDHLTHNVPTGQMNDWCEFYRRIFNFSETRYFDIKGVKTGLISKVMSAPGNVVTIPINEPAENELGKKSQIQEFLEEYKGAGIQHIALKTESIIEAIEYLRAREVSFLDIPDTYYDNLKGRVSLIKEEDIPQLKKNRILGDGDNEGYLLQIFTKNVIGPIFFEVIQRQSHAGFGEGNFQALFDAIERDQIQRGYLDTK